MKYCSKIKLILLLFFFTQSMFAFESIEVLNPNIIVNKSGYFVTDKNLTSNEAYAEFENNKFIPLPKEAKSFGFDPFRDYWYAFTISIPSNNSKKFYLDILNPTANFCDLYIYKNNSLVLSQASGYFVKVNDRPVKTFPIRFELSQPNAVYLLKIRSSDPRFSAFSLGLHEEVDQTWDYQLLLFAFISGIFTFVSLFSLLFYFKLKEPMFLYYIIYIFGLYASIVLTKGYTQEIMLIINKPSVLAVLFLQIQIIGLTLFSERFLEIQTKMPSMKRKIRYTAYLGFIVACFTFFAPPLQAFTFILATVLFCMLLYVGFKILLQGFAPAKYYLLTTGTALILMTAFTLTHQGVIGYGFLSSNLLSFALIWDMIFLTLAIANKVDLLQKDNIQQERILMFKSRQELLGEMSSNIAHQWRTPLGEIGSILTTIKAKLLYASMPKEEIVDSINRSEVIFLHLSQTVNTFMETLSSSAQKVEFDLSSATYDVIEFIKPTFSANNIEIKTSIENNRFIFGSQNAIKQAMLVILQNAKDAIVKNKTPNGKIEISLFETDGLIKLGIRDNGGGIDKAVIKKLFEPFVTTKNNGIGIGLFLAKSIIEKQYNGKIDFMVRDNQTEFVIVLDNRF